MSLLFLILLFADVFMDPRLMLLAVPVGLLGRRACFVIAGGIVAGAAAALWRGSIGSFGGLLFAMSVLAGYAWSWLVFQLRRLWRAE